MNLQRINIVLASLAALALVASTASAQLVNPGYDNAAPGPGPVGSFGLVVGPPFSPGFWGAEASSIVTTGGGPGGPVAPNSGPNMLQMNNSGDTVTESWQVVNVSGSLPPNPAVTFSALFNASSSAPSAIGAVRVFAFTAGNNWPTFSTIAQTQATLDASAQTWQPISVGAVSIPANTDWILAETYYVNSTLGLSGGRAYVDDTRLTITSIPEPSSLALGALALVGVSRLRKRRK